MSGSEILIAGDSNLRRVVELNKDPQIDVLCVGGAKIVGDRKGFWDKLLEALKLTEATTLVLHMGSNDVHTISTSPTTFVRVCFKMEYRILSALCFHIVCICIAQDVLENHAKVNNTESSPGVPDQESSDTNLDPKHSDDIIAEDKHLNQTESVVRSINSGSMTGSPIQDNDKVLQNRTLVENGQTSKENSATTIQYTDVVIQKEVVKQNINASLQNNDTEIVKSDTSTSSFNDVLQNGDTTISGINSSTYSDNIDDSVTADFLDTVHSNGSDGNVSDSSQLVLFHTTSSYDDDILSKEHITSPTVQSRITNSDNNGSFNTNVIDSSKVESTTQSELVADSNYSVIVQTSQVSVTESQEDVTLGYINETLFDTTKTESINTTESDSITESPVATENGYSENNSISFSNITTVPLVLPNEKTENPLVNVSSSYKNEVITNENEVITENGANDTDIGTVLNGNDVNVLGSTTSGHLVQDSVTKTDDNSTFGIFTSVPSSTTTVSSTTITSTTTTTSIPIFIPNEDDKNDVFPDYKKTPNPKPDQPTLKWFSEKEKINKFTKPYNGILSTLKPPMTSTTSSTPTTTRPNFKAIPTLPSTTIANNIIPKIDNPPWYIVAIIKMSWPELCPKRRQFKLLFIKAVTAHSGKDYTENQIYLDTDTNCDRKSRIGRQSQIEARLFGIDKGGEFSYDVTEGLVGVVDSRVIYDVLGASFKDKIIDMKIHGVNKYRKPTPAPATELQTAPSVLTSGIIAGIAIASFVCVFLMVLAILQLAAVARRRNVKKMRPYDPRYSVDLHSLAESIQLGTYSRNIDNRFAYTNPTLECETKNYASNAMNFLGLASTVRDEDAIDHEYMMLPSAMPQLSDIPQGCEEKNRYANIFPIPQTRVLLQPEEEEDEPGYINASYIRGFHGAEERYIATQAPMNNTVEDFWQMIWEQESEVVIMLTPLEERGLCKCVEYWPNTEGGDTMRIWGNYSVVQQRRDVRKEWIHTVLMLKNMKTNKFREVYHYWLTAWPTEGLPDHRTVIQFLLEIRPYLDSTEAPVVVHCSAGTGRTGTLIAIDIGMLAYEDMMAVDVLGSVFQMRQDRGGMVQSKQQYAFIYKVLYEYARMLHKPRDSGASTATLASLQVHSSL